MEQPFQPDLLLYLTISVYVLSSDFSAPNLRSQPKNMGAAAGCPGGLEVWVRSAAKLAP